LIAQSPPRFPMTGVRPQWTKILWTKIFCDHTTYKFNKKLSWC